MTRRSRQALAMAAALAASCTFLDPLGGLTGGGIPADDASTCDGPNCGVASDSPSEGETAGESGSEGGSDSGGPTPDAAADVGNDVSPIEAASEAAVDAGSLYAATVLADMPLAYWRLGDAPTSGTCHDETGNGNDATVIGGVTLGVPGALLNDPDPAAHFDGNTAVLSVGNKFDFAGTVPLTIELWVKPDVLDTTYRHLEGKMLYDDAGQPYDGIYMYVHGGTTLGYERWGNGSIDNGLSSTAVTANSWWHVVGTYGSGNMTLYVNGAPVQGGPTAISVTANSVSFQLGDQYQGSLDEVALYGTPLSAPRVLAHYHASGR